MQISLQDDTMVKEEEDLSLTNGIIIAQESDTDASMNVKTKIKRLIVKDKHDRLYEIKSGRRFLKIIRFQNKK